MISVILVEPRTSGNVGSIARVMRNFGFTRLVIMNPKCNYLDHISVSRAKHAKSILARAQTVSGFDDLSKFHTLIATTAAIGTDYNVARLPLTPIQLAAKLKGYKKRNIGLVFGRDSIGLKNAEIEKCDFTVSIPSSVKYRALNLSHAVAIILYELSKSSKMKKVGYNYVPASSKEKEIIMGLIADQLHKMPFNFKSQHATQIKIWTRLIGKSMLSRREAFGIMGFFRKVSRFKR